MKTGFEIKPAGKKGNGLFAARVFEKDEAIYRYTPRVVRKDELKTLTKEERTHLDAREDGDYNLIPEPLCFMNHSCLPNVVEKSLVGYAIKRIEVGEELTIDYELDGYFSEPMTCLCATEDCRGVLGQ